MGQDAKGLVCVLSDERLRTKWDSINIRTPLSFLDGQEKLALTEKMWTKLAHALSTRCTVSHIFKPFAHRNLETGRQALWLPILPVKSSLDTGLPSQYLVW